MRFHPSLLYGFLSFGLLFWGLSLHAQGLIGDVDGNQTVEHFDMLYIGYAFGATGTPVPTGTPANGGSAPAPQWDESFPSGLNYAQADIDGNGVMQYCAIAGQHFCRLYPHITVDGVVHVVVNVVHDTGCRNFGSGQFDDVVGLTQQLRHFPGRVVKFCFC